MLCALQIPLPLLLVAAAAAAIFAVVEMVEPTRYAEGGMSSRFLLWLGNDGNEKFSNCLLRNCSSLTSAFSLCAAIVVKSLTRCFQLNEVLNFVFGGIRGCDFAINNIECN